MRITLFITAFAAFFHCAVYSQSCLQEGITFETQAQIDSFQVNYPGCTEIMGDVTINGSNITNLNGLSILTSIDGFFLIGDELNASNPLLTSLMGLEELTFIGGNLKIHANTALTSLSGLEGLASIGGYFEIRSNESLASLAGLEHLNSVGGHLNITSNDSLTSLTGLDSIDAGSITELSIIDNTSLSYCEVQSICNYLSGPSGTINIYGNATGCKNLAQAAIACGIAPPCLPYGNYHFNSQTEIDSFPAYYPGCTILEGHVYIEGPDIVNLIGLNVVTSIGGGLYFYNNNVLPSLDGMVGLTSIGEVLYITYNNALTSLTGLEGLASTGGGVIVEANGALTCMDGLDGLTTIGGSLYIHANDALVSLAGLEGLTSIGDHLIIDYNDSLVNLSGLDNLISIGDFLRIGSNHVLTSLAALDNLTSVEGFLEVVDNNKLTSLTGLDHIDAGSITDLSIWYNDMLSICDVQCVCNYLTSPNGDIYIHNNSPGCNNPEEVESACGIGLTENDLSEYLFTISPNPSSTTINIEINNTPQKNTFMTIFNINGQQILKREITEQQTVINVSELLQGVYFVSLSNDRTVMVGKFVKK